MAASDRHSGKAVFLEYTPSGGSAIDLHVDYRNFGHNKTVNEIDATAGDDDWEYFVSSFKRGEVTITVLAGLSTYYLEPDTSGSLIYGSKGEANGMRKVTIPVKLLGVNEREGYADVATLDLTFRQTADHTVGTFST